MDAKNYSIVDFKELRADAGKRIPEAQFELGLRYYEGRDCPRKNQPLGVDWMCKAADGGCEQAINTILEIAKKRPTYRHLLNRYIRTGKQCGVAMSEDVLKFSGDKDTCIKIIKECLGKEKPDAQKAVYWANKSRLSFKDVVDIVFDLIKCTFTEKTGTKLRIRYERAFAQFIFRSSYGYGDSANSVNVRSLYEVAVSFIQGNGLPECKTIGANLLLKIYNVSDNSIDVFQNLVMSLCYCYIKGIGISKNLKSAALLYVIAGRPKRLTAFATNSQNKGVSFKKPSGRLWNYYVASHWLIQKIMNPVKRASRATAKTSANFVSSLFAGIFGIIFLGPSFLIFAWLLYNDSKLRMETMCDNDQDEILRANAVGGILILFIFQLIWSCAIAMAGIACLIHLVFALTWNDSFQWGFGLAFPVGFLIFWYCASFVSDTFDSKKR